MAEHHDLMKIEEKWQKIWEEGHVFEPVPDGRPKFFATYPYSYMNGIPHIGHAFTSLRVEFACRYRRMRGYNVLFPFAFHCTGMPIVAAASRIAAGEKTQIDIMKSMGIPAGQIERFSDPEYWTEYFPSRWESSMRRLGMSIDWRRKFITTPLNPFYDAFVRWQFGRLKEGNYIRKGSHPVIWCPHDEIPVGDHDRKEGEGETPVEYTLLKFRRADGTFLVAATLRPETCFGQTNVWVNPSVIYGEFDMGGESWIMSIQAAEKLSLQSKRPVFIRGISGTDMLFEMVYSWTMKRSIPVFPASFADPDRGTGIVSSVPSDSPDDYVTLLQLKADASAGKYSGRTAELIEAANPIEIIETPGYGPLPAKVVVERMGIHGQDEEEKLEAARAEIYRAGFYSGEMIDGEGKHEDVAHARERIRSMLLSEGWADTMYEPSGTVICRCLTRCVVKVVEDQWFLAYGDREWKEKAHRAVSQMRFFPPFLSRQFDNVIDWLRDWACAHRTGMGTSLPWDAGWKIESLSDSTVYMAYYTISHNFPPRGGGDAKVPDDHFFDFVLLGKGDISEAARSADLPEERVRQMREEFLYWYPVDLRNSGKDLVGNHLAFCIFNHTAIFREEFWPRVFSVNGWITVSGSKMSKSTGNSVYLEDALQTYGADVTRLTEAYAGEGYDDPNWDSDFAESAGRRLVQLLETAEAVLSMPEGEKTEADRWLCEVTDNTFADYIDCMEEMLFKSAVKKALLDMQNNMRWYMRRKLEKPDRETVRRYLTTQLMMLYPFTPHVCEEAWEILGNDRPLYQTLIPDPERHSETVEMIRESYLMDLLADVEEIRKVLPKRQKAVTVYVAEQWKRELLSTQIQGEGDQMRGSIMQGTEKKELEVFFKKLAQERKQGKLSWRYRIAQEVDELSFLTSCIPFLEREFGCAVKIASGPLPDETGAAVLKRISAFPGRPAVYFN